MDSASSSKQPLEPINIFDEAWQEKERFNKMSSFKRAFYNSEAGDDATGHCNVNDMDHMIAVCSAMSMGKEARARYRMELLTYSQWKIVMESCDIPIERGASIANMLKEVMAWRRERGEFNYVESFDVEEGFEEVEDEVPNTICDDMEGVNEASLDLGFLKTDLQVECLLRGICYQGSDTKAQLIAKLMEHKQNLLSENSLNSFHTLAEQSK